MSKLAEDWKDSDDYAIEFIATALSCKLVGISILSPFEIEEN
jgi:hypothetical protein